jgi:hypothetical protein
MPDYTRDTPEPQRGTKTEATKRHKKHKKGLFMPVLLYLRASYIFVLLAYFVLFVPLGG